MKNTIFIFVAILILSMFSSCDLLDGGEKDRLRGEITLLQKEVARLTLENARLHEINGDPLPVAFEVQIGAFQNFDVDAYADELVRFAKIQADGMNKYVLGRFAFFEDAERFLADIRTMGLDDAFIAGVVNGQRTTVEEAKKAAANTYDI